MREITSKDNQKLKFARKVGTGKVEQRIFVEGRRLAEEVLKSSVTPTDIFVSEQFRRKNKEILVKLSNREITISILSDRLFESIAKTKSSQGILLICEKPETGKHVVESGMRKTSSRLPITIALHQINNPSNLGAILRIAEASGVAGVITTKNSADVFSPKALRGAMGASIRVPLWTGAELDEILLWGGEKNLITTCADARSKQSYLETNWKTSRLLIFGSEATGLSDAERNKINEKIMIPMDNNVESLNLAVSCGVILFEAKRICDLDP